MLVTADRFINLPVMSLQTGSELARTARTIIDPRDLSVAAYELTGRLLDQTPSLLRINDIREIGPLGMIIDSSDEIVGIDDIIDLRRVYNFNFSLEGKIVIDESGKKIGKVSGYTLTTESFVIQQLQVKRSFFKSFGDTELLIHRSQVVKTSDTHITVKSATVSHKDPNALFNPDSYENPFRKKPRTRTD